MSGTYQYIDETSIDSELICRICHSPLTDPRCTPCGEIFCHECITNWIQTQNASCPHCRQALSIDSLTQTPRSLRNMLNRLPVKCTVCGQNGLLRGNIAEHLQKACSKLIVFCQSADIKCPWRGPRDQLNEHLAHCQYEPMRSIIADLLTENQQLADCINQKIVEITEQQNKLRQLTEQLNEQKAQYEVVCNENQTLTEQVTQFEIQVNTYQRQNQQLTEQLRETEAQLTSISNHSQQQQLDCGGRACSKCGKCCDWYYYDYDINDYINNDLCDGATCRNINGRDHMCDCEHIKGD